jgi:hypothetical protein
MRSAGTVTEGSFLGVSSCKAIVSAIFTERYS